MELVTCGVLVVMSETSTRNCRRRNLTVGKQQDAFIGAALEYDQHHHRVAGWFHSSAIDMSALLLSAP